MPVTATSYPAKILLFGEHTVLRGGLGLAVPYPKFSLRWARGAADERLLKFSNYLTKALDPWWLDSNSLRKDLLAGWQLEGNIPLGYGLGSSGAVCAAVWDRYATVAGKRLRGEVLRDRLSRMEQHFHGSSSGTDPLISYLNRPLLIGGGKPPREVTLPEGWRAGFFLLDTGVSRSAAPLIEEFTRRYDREEGFRARARGQWTQPAEAAINALLANERPDLAKAFATITRFQRDYLPNNFLPGGWRERLSGPQFNLKICGAGGGGMLLGLGKHPQGLKL